MSIATYSRVNKVGETDRMREARVLIDISRRLEVESRSGRMTPSLAAALQDNSRFWSTVLHDLSDAGNGLDQALKASLISIGIWMTRTGLTAGSDLTRVRGIIEINQAIARGLAETPVPPRVQTLQGDDASQYPTRLL